MAEVVEAIAKLTVLEVSRLVKAMEEKFGVSASAAMAMPAAAAGAAAAAPAEEKTTFDVVIKDGGASKIKVIKVVRELTNMGLKDAKDLVDKGNATVKEGVSKEEAEAIKKQIEESGGTVEIR
ncbi:MAG: 50S ribosomal protein L7/L12 [Planctomycetota bacterium]